ncbi:hypothetical protein JNB91_28325 [Rhizobium wenxiniae]|uniref:hypothetical protein n=1 Tax=Rhizobium wenxiniae TaxID=1737357 RepID=UPI001C6E21CE|nr:hypothetical protein [Rhizobium wenxiniae]MBW9091702.1 hypothetical protein [Rhizobium wenxiniae]
MARGEGRAAFFSIIFAALIFAVVAGGLWWMTDHAGNLDTKSSIAYSNETGQEFRSLTGRLFQRYTGRGSEAKPDGRNVSGSWFINVGVYRLGQA